MAARNRPLIIGGLALASAAGYYLYRAGGDPNVAQRKAEHDAARLSSKVKSELPGTQKEVTTKAKELGAEVGSKIDETMNTARAKTHEFDSKVEAYRRDAEKKIDHLKNETAKDLNKAVDSFDQKVTEGAAKAKSGLSSWFGGK